MPITIEFSLYCIPVGILLPWYNVSGACNVSSFSSDTTITYHENGWQCIQYILVPAISGASIVTSSLSLSVSQLLNEQCKQVTCHAVQIQVLYLSDSDEQLCRMAVIFCKLK